MSTLSKLSSELLSLLQSHIRAHGALPLPRFMSLCLQHPTLGYYARQRTESGILGKQGDFITSPEISQVFGELLGVWFVSQWQAQGSPSKSRIVELGPGRGTLMDDLLRTFDRIKPFGQTLQHVHLVESSSYMRDLQRDKLQARTQGRDLQWHQQLEELQTEPSKDTFTMLIAHEFFDALPINVFEKRPESWREAHIVESSGDNVIAGRPAPPLKMALSPSATLGSQIYCKHSRLDGLSTGTRVEISPESYAVAAQCSKLVGSTGLGAGLIVDYGDDRFFSNSFRGFREHKLVEPLTGLGETDLTANVDFSFLREALELHTQPTPLMTQRDFLGHMGLGMRAEGLMKRASSPEQAKRIEDAALRLVDSTGMGQQYKVMGFTPKLKPESTLPPFPFSMIKPASKEQLKTPKEIRS